MIKEGSLPSLIYSGRQGYKSVCQRTSSRVLL
jgi:hypothetical protein